MENEKNNETPYDVTYGVVNDKIISSILDSFKEGFYSDFQQVPKSREELLNFTEEQSLQSVDAFLSFVCQDIKPLLLKSIEELKEYVKKM